MYQGILSRLWSKYFAKKEPKKEIPFVSRTTIECYICAKELSSTVELEKQICCDEYIWEHELIKAMLIESGWRELWYLGGNFCCDECLVGFQRVIVPGKGLCYVLIGHSYTDCVTLSDLKLIIEQEKTKKCNCEVNNG